MKRKQYYKATTLFTGTAAIIAALSFCGCDKENGNDNPVLIYAKGNSGNTTTGQIIHTAAGKHFVQLEAAFICAATREMPADETIHLNVDNTLVAGYNAQHETACLPAPEGSYAFSHEAAATIRSGNFRSTDTLRLSITKPDLFEEGDYLLPVRLTPATHRASSNFGVVYILLRSYTSNFRGATSVPGTLTDPDNKGWSVTSSDGYYVSNILGNLSNYWYINETPATAVINFKTVKTLKGLRFVTYGNSYAIGSIALEASSDSLTWTKLGAEPLLPPVKYNRFVQQYLEFYTPLPAQYLKLGIEKPGGGTVVINLFSIIE
jgi:hypothetical protein